MIGAPSLKCVATALVTCGLALLLSPAAHSQTIDLSLNVYYDIPADVNSGGAWKLVGKSSNFGIAGINVALTGITGVPVNEAPRGNVNGSDPAGFGIFEDLVGSYLVTQQPAFPTAGEREGAFYGVGIIQNGQPGTIGPAFPGGTLTNLQDVPWATGDDLVTGPSVWDAAATFLSGTFAANTQPAFGGNVSGRVFTTAGTSTTFGQADLATITTTIRTNFDPGTSTPDYNGNGIVDAADYVVWRKGIFPAADGNNSGGIDNGDYTVWRTAFGQVPPPGGSGAVPEPTSALMACFALLYCAFTRRRSA